MYADRRNPEGFKPGSLGIALAVNGAVVGALLFVSPHVTTTPREEPLTIYPVAIDPPPAPLPPPKSHARTPSTPTIAAPETIVTVPLAPMPLSTAPDPAPMPAAGGGTGVAVDPAPTASPTPVLVDAAIDPRYAGDLQPTYPTEERRAGREGRVVVRVLIGVDGRVKQIEPVSATSEALFRATQARAISRWRFRPATRDGIPVEAWRTMALRFVLQE